MDEPVKARVDVRYASFSERRSRDLALAPWYVSVARERGRSILITSVVSRKGALAAAIIDNHYREGAKGTHLAYGNVMFGGASWKLLEGLATFGSIRRDVFESLLSLIRDEKYEDALVLLRTAKLIR